MSVEQNMTRIPEGLEIKEYNGEGYDRTHTYGAWRVAFLNHAERFENTTYLERHLLTDEVFLLLNGEATLQPRRQGFGGGEQRYGKREQ